MRRPGRPSAAGCTLPLSASGPARHGTVQHWGTRGTQQVLLEGSIHAASHSTKNWCQERASYDLSCFAQAVSPHCKFDAALCRILSPFIPHLFWLATKCPHPHSSSLFMPSFLFQVRANLVPRYHSLPVLCFRCLLRQCIYFFFLARPH